MLPLTLSNPSFSTSLCLLSMMFLLSLSSVANPCLTLWIRSFGIHFAMLRIGRARMKNPMMRWIRKAEGRGFFATADGENIPANAVASLFVERLSESKW